MNETRDDSAVANYLTNKSPVRPAHDGLTGQQMQAMANQHAAALQAIRRDIETRKWAVDQACGLVGTQAEAEVQVMLHPVQLAREIHAFLVEGAAEQ
jgi:hypothetical protein